MAGSIRGRQFIARKREAAKKKKKPQAVKPLSKEMGLWDILNLDVGALAKKRLAKAPVSVKNLFVRDWLLTRLKWQAGMLEHSMNVSNLSHMIAKEMGVRGSDLKLAARAGLLHDAGKVYDKKMARLIRAKRKLTEKELEYTRKHAELGARMISKIEPEPVVRAVIEHQELFSGKGYPLGLSGEKISLVGSIITVADHYFSSIEKRAYRPALSKKEALEYIRKQSGKRLDPEAVRAFFKVVEKNPRMFR